MGSKKSILISVAAVIIILFAFFFVKVMTGKNVSVQKANPAEIEKNDVKPETEIKKDKISSPILSKDSMGPVASSGKVLSVADDTVKIKESTSELDLRFSPYTKYFLIEAPNPPVLKDKAILKEGRSVLFEYDKGTLILNSIIVQ